MQFFTIATLFLATAFAAPAQEAHNAVVARGPNAFCPPGLLYTNPLCCKTNVLGVVDLDCEAPASAPSNCRSFTAICANVSREPKCCGLPVAGQALLCVDPVGAGN